jgi:hypothetical protein
MKFLGATFCLGNDHGSAQYRLDAHSVLAPESQTTGLIVVTADG